MTRSYWEVRVLDDAGWQVAYVRETAREAYDLVEDLRTIFVAVYVEREYR